MHVYRVCVQLCPISNWTWALCHASQSYWFLTAHTCEHAQTYYCSYLPCPKVIFPGINATIETGWAETEKHSRCLLVHHDNTHISNIHKYTNILIPHLLISSLPWPYLNKRKKQTTAKKIYISDTLPHTLSEPKLSPHVGPWAYKRTQRHTHDCTTLSLNSSLHQL